MTRTNSLLYISQLKQAFSLRKEKNPRYSLRSFARDLGLSPSTLSPLLKGNKGLSEERALEVASRLGLSKKDKKTFALSIQSRHGRSKTSRNLAQRKLESIEIAMNSRVNLSSNKFASANRWYCFAILELLEIFEEGTASIRKIAQRLGLAESTVAEALKDLESLNLIEKQGSFYKATSSQTEVSTLAACPNIQKYHAEILDIAKDTLKKDPLESRDFNNVTLAFNSSKMDEAKEFIRDFQESFFERFYHNVAPKDSVYQLSLQLFRLDKDKDL